MLTWLKTFVTSLLWDEAAAQRYVAAGTYMVGDLLQSGGVVPGTSSVLPIPHAGELAPYGVVLKAIGIYLGAGGVLPSGKTPAPPKP